MRIPILVATAALLVAGAAHANVFDAKALAKYDVSYQKCETQIPQMQGRRDAIYLGLYRIKADARSLARLNKLRSSPDYVAEKRRAASMPAKSGAVAASAAAKLARECQALYGESGHTPN